MRYQVVLKSLINSEERIVLTTCTTHDNAEHFRKSWRKALGDKKWTVNRRPGADTLDHLMLTIEQGE